MKIKDIKDDELRALAESRVDPEWEDYFDNGDLDCAFLWDSTREGYSFWEDVYEGIITEVPPHIREKPLELTKEEAEKKYNIKIIG